MPPELPKLPTAVARLKGVQRRMGDSVMPNYFGQNTDVRGYEPMKPLVQIKPRRKRDGTFGR